MNNNIFQRKNEKSYSERERRKNNNRNHKNCYSRMRSSSILYPFLLTTVFVLLHEVVANPKFPVFEKKHKSKEILTSNPIIGIFAQPSKDAHPACDSSCDYIAASYVKWIEGAGGK